MKLNKQQEAEALVAYKTYFDSYIGGDVQTIASLLNDDYTQIGSAEAEVFFDKKEAVQFLNETIDQVAGKAEMRNRVLKAEHLDGYILIIDLFDMYVLIADEWTFYSKFRASTLLEKKETGWKFVYQHSSMPDARAQEGDNIAIEKIAEENQQLREAVKRRTVELENKSRELEIEAALEKVRSRSLAMHQTEELQEVVTVVVEKLLELGIILDAGGAIICTYFQDSKDVLQWIASPDFSYSGSYLLHYFDHPIFNDSWNFKESGIDFSSKSYSVEEKNSFFEYAFEHTDYKKFPDEFKNWIFENNKHSLSFAWSKNSAILISSHTGALPSESDRQILIRFAKVFEQAYTRFLDLQKAEAQAREAQIEAALERIRSKVLAMQSSSDLLEVSIVLREQMGNLGQEELESSIVHLYNNTETLEAWYTFRSTETNSTKIVTDKAIIQVDSCDYIKETIEKYNSKETEYNIVSNGKKLTDWYNIMVKVAPDTIEYDDDGKMIVPDILYYHHSKFSGGALLMISNEKPSDEAKELQKRAAKVFNLAYQRFLDLQQAEARTKETIKQASLDRVRGEIASMRSKDDLSRITPLIWQELTNHCCSIYPLWCAYYGR